MWGETYDVSAEKNASSNEQITLHSTRMSSVSTLQITRNDSVSMDISSMSTAVTPSNDLPTKPTVTTRASILRNIPAFSEDQKENIPITNDSEIELSLIMPAPPAPQQPIFKTADAKPNIVPKSKISIFDFSLKKSAQNSQHIAENTNGSDNMDISGIEPSISTAHKQETQTNRGNTYRDWLERNNLIAKSNNDADNGRQTINHSISFIKAQSNMAMKPLQNKRKTVNEPLDISVDVINENHPKRNAEQNSIDISIEVLPSEAHNRPSRRQTTHQVQDIDEDISWEKPTTPTVAAASSAIDSHQQEVLQVQDMSLDTVQWDAASLQSAPHRNLNRPQSALRKTINEPREMSFDSTCKSNAPSQCNKTVLADISMDLQSTEHCNQLPRRSVICKSPSKNMTNVYDISEEIELTKGLEQNSLYLSYHPLHSTKLNDINNTKFTEMDFDESAAQVDKIESSAIDISVSNEELAIGKVPLPRKSVQIFNQTKSQTIRGTFNLDISTESPVPTAKKYNLNKTPFYYGMDKENDPALIETMHASDLSSLDLTNQSKDLEQSVEIKQSPPPQANEPRRGTVLFHTTIGNDTELEAANESDLHPIEISDALDESVAPESVTTAMDVDVLPRIESKPTTPIMTQSILHLTPIQIDESITEKLPFPSNSGENHRLTINKFDSSAMNESPFNYGNMSNYHEESKQLTFIEDDDVDDQICNTKLDLADSLESSEINDFIDRKCASFVNRSYNISRFSMHSAHSETSIASIKSERLYPMEANKDTIALTDEIPPLPEAAMSKKELEAFKKSNRLRHSNVFDGNTTDEKNPSESIANTDEVPNKMISLAQISRSSIMQRRSSVGANSEANETSFLLKEVTDIPLSEIKLDFTGYEKMVGLATPEDVFKDFCNRMQQIRLKAQKWEDDRKKLENGEIEYLDPFNNNDEELVSQNVEAPSWTFLYRNKLKCEE